MKTEPQNEHHWLQKLVGEWTYEIEADMGNGGPAKKLTGTEAVRPIGGLWILAEGKGETPTGEPATSMMTLGYDPQKQRYVGTWIGSMMTHLWVYDGEMDEANSVLTLASEGPDFGNHGKMGKYRDVIEIKDDNHRVLRSYRLGEDGEWHAFMTASYRRKG